MGEVLEFDDRPDCHLLGSCLDVVGLQVNVVLVVATRVEDPPDDATVADEVAGGIPLPDRDVLAGMNACLVIPSVSLVSTLASEDISR